jgi:hypothetical protein
MGFDVQEGPVPARVTESADQIQPGTERLGRRRVAHPGLHDLDRLAVPDQQGRVEVPQVMHAGARQLADGAQSLVRPD